MNIKCSIEAQHREKVMQKQIEKKIMNQCSIAGVFFRNVICINAQRFR